MWADQFAWNKKQLLADLLKREVLPGFIQAVSLKRGDQIVRKADDLQVEGVGSEGRRVNLAHRKVFAQLAKPSLHRGRSIIEMPDPGWRHRQVGDPRAIDVADH